MTLRALGSILAAALAVAGLVGCETKVGQAAVVNGVALSDTELSTYVTRKAVPYADQQTGDTVVPKVQALGAWIDAQLFRRVVERHGGSVTTQERNTLDAIVLGTTTREQFVRSVSRYGFTSKFADLVIEEQELYVLLAKRLHPDLSDTDVLQGLSSGLGGEVFDAMRSGAGSVTVSGRYGAWQPDRLAMSQEPGSGLPSFIDVGSATTTR